MCARGDFWRGNQTKRLAGLQATRMSAANNRCHRSYACRGTRSQDEEISRKKTDTCCFSNNRAVRCWRREGWYWKLSSNISCRPTWKLRQQQPTLDMFRTLLPHISALHDAIDIKGKRAKDTAENVSPVQPFWLQTCYRSIEMQERRKLATLQT